jgi:outer membrane receptor protein involved in Fe transport
MKFVLRNLMLGSSLAAMAAASLLGTMPASAQGAGENAPNVEAITVTGSRISIQGYEAPTPVTVISEEQLNRDAKISIMDSIAQLPSVGVSETPNNGVASGDLSQGDASLSVVNLRNLGIARTLVLFDGQRVVSSNIFGGGVDISTIPTELVKRVDVVTGGASAAYGSDAVAGVVNLVLDKTFTGLKADLEGGDSTTVQHRQIKMALSVGTDFAGGKGHLILSGDHTWSNDPVFNNAPDWYNNGAIVQNPAATTANGLPWFIHVRNTGQAQYTQGGLIRANTAGGVGSSITANSLIGTQFVNNGVAAPFNFGTVDGTHPNVCYAGCSGNAQNYPYTMEMLAVPYHATTLFGYASYNVTPDIKASVQLNYGEMAEHSVGGTRTSTVNIAADNAFLPSSIASQFGTLSNGYNALTGASGTATAPTQTVTIGTINTNNVDLNKPLDLTTICNSLGVPCLKLNRALTRGVFTLEGSLGSDWSWEVYAQHSQLRERQSAAQDSYGPHYNYAIDSVKVTPTNQGTSNLPIGSIQCRAVLLGDPNAAGCTPLNIFGNGTASNAAILYVNPGKDPHSGLLNQELIILNQDVFSGSMQGVLPWELPAGKVAVAFGGEYRHEQGNQSQILPQNQTTPWAAGNFRPYSGQYDVQEGFVEADVPVLKDNVVKDLNFNMAGRITNYSTSGVVETWKLGATSQIDDNIKLRATWSLDIRAPLISDLFSPGVVGISQVQYPLGSPSYQLNGAQGGNPALQPEKAITTSLGVVLTPQFIQGLSVSLDWYTINIHSGIYTTDIQTIINRCLQGEQVYCPFLLFSPNINGGLKPYQVNQIPANAAGIKTSGVDVQANYVMDLLGGSLDWALVGNYTSELTQNAVGITYDSAGALGSPISYAASGLPKTRAVLSATYTQGPWSGTIQTRVWGGAVLTNGVENLPPNVARASLSPAGVLTLGAGNGNLLDNNHVNPVAYLDLRLAYRWTDNIELYSAIDNVTSVPKPQDGSSAVYDIFGRTIRGGLRFNY